MLSISINSAGSSDASEALLRSLQRHQKNVSNLSSGSQISEISDDSAGFAVAFTLNNTSLRSKNIASNIANGLSYLEQQASGLQKISGLLSRMSELTTKMMDPSMDQTPSQADSANSPQSDIMQEMNSLRSELQAAFQEKFIETNVFHTLGAKEDLNVILSADAQQQITITQASFASYFDVNTLTMAGNPSWATLADGSPPTDVPSTLTDATQWGVSEFQTLLDGVSQMITDNASQQSQLRSALDNLAMSDHHLSDANSRIYDVDVAREVSHMARNQLLIDASASAMAQSNVTSAAVLKIITG